jgi:hypothetical protein
MTIYRSSSGKFKNFIAQLGIFIVQKFILSRGDFNTDHLKDTDRARQLNSLLKTYNLINTIIFPTRIRENSSTAAGNNFLDISKHDKYRVPPLHNGLSDHKASIFTIYNASGYFNNYLEL